MRSNHRPFQLAVLLFVALLAGYAVLGRFDSRETKQAFHRSRPPSGAMEALNFFSAARAYPNRIIPDQGFYRAFEFTRTALAKGNVQSLANSQWKLLGPQNIGGRTNAIAINPKNPNTIYVGAASGGLWRSFTGGVGAQAWEYVETGFPVLGVGAIVIDPADTNVIYVGTGEVYGYQDATGGVTVRTTRGSYGIGILKTTDGGATWSKSLDWSYHQRRGVQALALHPSDSRILYAGTTEGTFKSSDAGATWAQVHSVLMAMDVDINPRHPDTVFVACGNLGSPGAGVYRTRDGGEFWQKLGNGLPANYTGKTVLAIHQANPQIMYADVANDFSGVGLFRSNDGGTSWEQVSNLNIAQYQGWYSHFVWVHPRHPDTVIVGGIDLWKSVDGGRTLRRKSNWAAWYFGVVPVGGPEGPPNYSHADHHAVAEDPVNPEIIYFTNDGGVFRSTDGGETFAGLNGGYATTQFYQRFSNAGGDSALAIGGLQDNCTVVYEGTPAWRRVLGGDGCCTAIDPFNDNIMYGASQYLGLYKSTNRGKENSWFGASNGIIRDTNTTGFVAPYLVAPSNGNILYAATDRVYKSTNAAGQWLATNNNFPLDGNPVLCLAVSATNPDTVYATTAPVFSRASIFFSSNGGATWEDITAGLPDRYPMDLAVDPHDSRKVYVVFSGFGTSHLFRSHDAGLTWVDIGTGLPDVPSSAIAIDPQFPHHLYFGNDLGVYVSRDGGAHWQSWQNNMPTALVMDLSVSPHNRALRAATHGNGVWERPLLGEPATVIAQPAAGAVRGFTLYQNYPNPVSRRLAGRGETTLSYQLQMKARVRLVIYNLAGQQLATVIDEMRPAGAHQVRVQLKDLVPGTYFLRLQVGELVQTRKLLVVD